ncbi:anthrone oxygenase family protein [Phytohabitans sp. LJ34]|uniref:anthrone oxygenase family protein n=1 Tax=Phytohabitans sp. LJ34 TaxID=3452217 RepID=UPI003F8BA78D
MRKQLAVTWVAVVLLGLIAGFFYAYACSVMVGLAETDDRTFIATMQAINANVRNAGFAVSFFGALAVTALAALLGLRRWRSPATILLVLAAVTYGVGGLALTMGVSVPLNEELAAAGAPDAIADPARVRAAYEGPWVTWNLVRAIASTVALGLAAAALHKLGHRKVEARVVDGGGEERGGLRGAGMAPGRPVQQ